MQGKIIWFNERKGFGFIATEGRKDVFVHVSGLTPRTKLEKDDAVSFDLVNGKKGEQAVNVKKTGG